MKILSFITDWRIAACNASVELTTSEYLEIAGSIIDKNEFQRKKVISSIIKKTLKEDLKKKCTIPAIVLGIKNQAIPDDFHFAEFNDEEKLLSYFKHKDLIILDGLQRTFVLLELFEEDPEGDWINQKLRCEVFIGLNKLGILYRMLTLNTGQTTMSTRHLLEILYYDYLNVKTDGIELVADKDEKKIEDPYSQFKFQDTIEGYNSFIEGKEVPIQRADILQNMETINNLEKTDDDKEGFRHFVKLFQKLLISLKEKYKSFEFNEGEIPPELQYRSSSFGTSVSRIFGKSQSFTGFGAACSFLKRNRGVGFQKIDEALPEIKVEIDVDIYLLNKHFDYIRNKSKKVGNDQRYYFKNFYQFLFDPDSESNLNINQSLKKAYTRIQERLEF
ncbi:hypothetical protein [Ekhidna sp.]|uniref:hypothetical protein n=1 Tax=Ekhidna sp. TaxID=2608089 RepID=UPI003296FA6A